MEVGSSSLPGTTFAIQNSGFKIQDCRPARACGWEDDDVFCIVRSLWFPVRNAAGAMPTSVGAGL